MKKLKRIAIAVFVAAAVVTGIIAALPHILCAIDWEEIEVDLSENLKGAKEGAFKDTKLRVKVSPSYLGNGEYKLDASGSLLGWPISASAKARTAMFFPGCEAEGTAQARFNGSQLKADFRFKTRIAYSLLGPKIEWEAQAEMPRSALTEEDPYLASLIKAFVPDETALKFSGELEFYAEARQTLETPVVEWSAKGRISNLDGSAMIGGKELKVVKFRTPFGAKGIAHAVTVSPMFMRTDEVEFGGVRLENVFASLRATETALLVTEAGAEVCGGSLRLYSFFLDPDKLNAGVTVFVEDVDAGDALNNIKGFTGTATGRLYGKFPLVLKSGSEIVLGKAYLNSVPGEKGNIKVYDAKPIMESLEMGGVAAGERENIAKALADLDYTVLRLELEPEAEGMALVLKLEGSAAAKGLASPVPVSLQIALHGDIEQLVNFGLRAATNKERGK